MARPLPLLLGVLAVVAALAAGAALLASWHVHTPYRGWQGDEVVVEISRGTTAWKAAEKLAAAGVVERPSALAWWLRWRGEAGRIHAGPYRFREAKTVAEVASMLVEGRVALEQVVVPEGFTRWQVARALADVGFGPYERALAATARGELVADLDPRAETLEGYLFPDTYRASRGTPVEELVERMVETFRGLWSAEWRRAAGDTDMSVREVVTLASLVEAEARLDEERELIAAVFLNRLDRGMLLQCDPTLLYALWLEQGRSDRDIRWGDFDLASPYNTYRYPGLPPGPIGNPGQRSIGAVLSPAEADFLYFVSRNDGSHVFSRTLSEHNANVRRYQR